MVTFPSAWAPRLCQLPSARRAPHIKPKTNSFIIQYRNKYWKAHSHYTHMICLIIYSSEMLLLYLFSCSLPSLTPHTRAVERAATRTSRSRLPWRRSVQIEMLIHGTRYNYIRRCSMLFIVWWHVIYNNYFLIGNDCLLVLPFHHPKATPPLLPRDKSTAVLAPCRNFRRTNHAGKCCFIIEKGSIREKLIRKQCLYKNNMNHSIYYIGVAKERAVCGASELAGGNTEPTNCLQSPPPHFDRAARCLRGHSPSHLPAQWLTYVIIIAYYTFYNTKCMCGAVEPWCGSVSIHQYPP